MAAGEKTPPEQPYERTDGPVHEWFGLSYANFLMWHRAHMQSMPLDWQQRFTELAEELDAAYPDGTGTGFEVKTVRWEQVADLGDQEREALGITVASDDEPDDDASPWDLEYYDSRDGRTLQGHDRVAVPVLDPVPHYDRGRTYLPPDEAGIAACKAARAADQPDGQRR